MSVDDSNSSVIEANNSFYRAFESGAIDRMEEVWAHDDWVRCIHPGWTALAGWEDVRESWKRILESGQKMRISPSDTRVYTSGDFAWVTCIENITVFQETRFETVQVVATNLFVRRDGRWLMVHHHASPLPVSIPEVDSDSVQ